MTQHIAFVVTNYPPRVGGVEKHVGALATRLAASGHRVSVFTLSDEPGTAREDGVLVRRLPRRFPVAEVIAFPPLGTTRRLARALRESGATIVSTHTRFFPMTWVGVRAAHRAGIPSMLTEHGSDHVRSSSPVIDFASRMVDRTFGRRALRRADLVLAVSREAAAFARRLAGVPSRLFYNAIDLAEWSPPAATATAAATRPRRIVFVGRLVPGKGWEDVLDASARIADVIRDAGIEVHILGGGPDLERCRARVATLGMSDVIEVHGAVGSATVRELLAGSVLVNASVLAEGFGITLLEAAAVGAQVVSYPIPAAPVLLEQGAPVRLVDPPTADGLAEAIVAAIEDPGPPMAPEVLATWSWDARADEFARLAEETSGVPTAR